MDSDIFETGYGIEVESLDTLQRMLGTLDENLSVIEKGFGVRTRIDGLSIIVDGDGEREKALSALKSIKSLAESGRSVNREEAAYRVNLIKEGREESLSQDTSLLVGTTYRGKPINAKTAGQARYVRAINEGTVTFGIGPAGTGKTYLAVCLAVTYLKRRDVEKIILTRPAVEAGEKLGFLPGDLQEKVDPYLRPLYDALEEMLGSETYERYMERGVIEIAPLAYMRGRTLIKSFIILDEAQNATEEQMKMFLTRLGEGSKMVVTGDVTQIDLPGKSSGLIEAARILDGVEDIKVCYLGDGDVVRHPLVTRIVRAYEASEERLKAENASKRAEKAEVADKDVGGEKGESLR